MNPHYRILGSYHGKSIEEIDESEDEGTARFLLGEYRLAYGKGWALSLEKQTFNKHGMLEDCEILDPIA